MTLTAQQEDTFIFPERLTVTAEVGKIHPAVQRAAHIHLRVSQPGRNPLATEIWFDGEVSPDFYGWIFPKTDHIAIGTGTEERATVCLPNALWSYTRCPSASTYTTSPLLTVP